MTRDKADEIVLHWFCRRESFAPVTAYHSLPGVTLAISRNCTWTAAGRRLRDQLVVQIINPVYSQTMAVKPQ